MTSLGDIQWQVDQLQPKILGNASQTDWQHDWGKIKSAIGQYAGLAKAEDRMRLGIRIHERLDSLGLQGSEPPPIWVEVEEKRILANPGAWKTPKRNYFRFPY